jgi:hypothetical protein
VSILAHAQKQNVEARNAIGDQDLS